MRPDWNPKRSAGGYKAWLGNGKRWITSGVNDEADAAPESSKERMAEGPLDSEDSSGGRMSHPRSPMIGMRI